ncbi:uncharacterized protein LOC115452735 [Manduca sexta]|uniref:Seminal fluid protein n=1 Tax=Manduca sexta TaxID=7130 RepID=A0A922CZA8_MANSE|nr:uncharacterized protein LOC115452735 [Manduca sexta]KAG6463987.1 hypothetical protein O3G_MSEX014204 [Manduca sexta]
MSKLAFIFILFALCANAEKNKEQSEDLKTHNDNVKSIFGRLLKSIVKINEQRYDAMKKLTKLQDGNVAMDVLRKGKHDSKEGLGSVMALVVLDEENPEKPEAKRLSADKADSFDNSDINSGEEKIKNQVDQEKQNTLRVWKSCQKKAAKVCRKACTDAYKTTCSEYACNRKMKKTLKKECRIACKNRFH